MRVIYKGHGRYLVQSRTDINKFHTVVPSQLYCSCKAIKLECFHLKEIAIRVKEKRDIENMFYL